MTKKYIDAEAFKRKLIDEKSFFPAMVARALEEMPEAEVEEVRRGTWLPQIVGGVKAWDCSECKTIGSPHWKRCPICEAKMDIVTEETI